jgi:nucleotide-binding universal stress UspA family protein
MFERILLAVDGSETSRKAIPVVAELAARFGSQVTVLHVREHELTWATDVDLDTVEEAANLVDGIVRDLKDAGVSALAEVRRSPVGLVPEMIVSAAEETDATLIAIGTRGLTDWTSLLLGSVAHKVVHHAGCPVLLVR